MRVFELARDIGVESKAVIAKLREAGVEVKSHMSAVEPDAIDLVRAELAPAAPAAAPEPAPAAAPAPPPEPQPAPAPETPPPEPAPEPAAEPGPATEPEPAAAPAGRPEKVVRTRGPLVVKDLAEQLGMRPNMVISELMKMNIFASINQRVELDVVRKIAEKHGFAFEQEKRAEHKPAPRKREEDAEAEPEDRAEDLVVRAPVVTFLGHVDHGKTSLLDRIRNATVAEGEWGGITQHIGAYTVDLDGRKITFLDTPGHAAFTAMRARGANLTDIAVIIIAADDGVMPQTREAIMHARAAEVTLMVAINKMDVPGANADRVRQQLQQEGLTPESWGGELICCEVSAQTGDGIDHLLEMILLQSEVLELRANPQRRARGYVVEGRMEPGMGPVADLLVTTGTLKLGDALLCGRHWGRVKALINDHGAKVKSAGPSVPVRCLGLSGVPEAGAEFRVCKSDRWARSRAETSGQDADRETLTVARKTSLDSLFAQLEDSEKLELKIVLKADTQGSLEAIVHALEEIKSDKISLNFVLTGTGNISVNDVMLASASDAVILGFHVGSEAGVDSMAKHEGVDIRLHQVIYELIDQVREAMTGMLAPVVKEEVLGRAEIRQVFTLGKTSKVAGCLVVSGEVRADGRVRVLRGEEKLFDGRIASLKHFQDDVRSVRESQECGIRIGNYTGFEAGDELECYELREVEQSL
jgi:translation initiation factor IF-2